MTGPSSKGATSGGSASPLRAARNSASCFRTREERWRIEAVDHEERHRGPLRPPTWADLLLGCGDEDGRPGAVWRGRVGNGRDEGEPAEVVQPLLAEQEAGHRPAVELV